MAELTLRNLTKVYNRGQPAAVDQVNLEVRNGEFVALLGPSGCGKSTTLRMVAGLETITSGDILIGGKNVNRTHPKDRGVGLAFENYALYPPLTVRDNLAFNLKARGVGTKDIEKRLVDIAEHLHIIDVINLKPAALSSGQKQRVNMARAMIRRPAVLLLDEPLSHLDPRLRVQMRTEIKRLHAEQRFTTIIVTHDQIEAMALADRIAVLNDGKLQQFDTPLEVFNHPSNEFVAGFLGEPPMNIFQVQIDSDRKFVIPETEFALPLDGHLHQALSGRSAAKLGIRPWGIGISQAASQDSIRGTVSIVEDLGDTTRVGVRYGEVLLMSSVPVTDRFKHGGRVHLTFNYEDLNLFDLETGHRISS
ncbi:MAG: ABC transporter ATP-binding protein [Verrucomicrobia bacterium]|nr:ABC transporter ATP-binding protein [Verrucomicrobiota bacterium]